MQSPELLSKIQYFSSLLPVMFPSPPLTPGRRFDDDSQEMQIQDEFELPPTPGTWYKSLLCCVEREKLPLPQGENNEIIQMDALKQTAGFSQKNLNYSGKRGMVHQTLSIENKLNLSNSVSRSSSDETESPISPLFYTTTLCKNVISEQIGNDSPVHGLNRMVEKTDQLVKKLRSKQHLTFNEMYVPVKHSRLTKKKNALMGTGHKPKLLQEQADLVVGNSGYQDGSNRHQDLALMCAKDTIKSKKYGSSNKVTVDHVTRQTRSGSDEDDNSDYISCRRKLFSEMSDTDEFTVTTNYHKVNSKKFRESNKNKPKIARISNEICLSTGCISGDSFTPHGKSCSKIQYFSALKLYVTASNKDKIVQESSRDKTESHSNDGIIEGSFSSETDSSETISSESSTEDSETESGGKFDHEADRIHDLLLEQHADSSQSNPNNTKSSVTTSSKDTIVQESSRDKTESHSNDGIIEGSLSSETESSETISSESSTEDSETESGGEFDHEADQIHDLLPEQHADSSQSNPNNTKSSVTSSSKNTIVQESSRDKTESHSNDGIIEGSLSSETESSETISSESSTEDSETESGGEFDHEADQIHDLLPEQHADSSQSNPNNTKSSVTTSSKDTIVQESSRDKTESRSNDGIIEGSLSSETESSEAISRESSTENSKTENGDQFEHETDQIHELLLKEHTDSSQSNPNDTKSFISDISTDESDRENSQHLMEHLVGDATQSNTSKPNTRILKRKSSGQSKAPKSKKQKVDDSTKVSCTPKKKKPTRTQLLRFGKLRKLSFEEVGNTSQAIQNKDIWKENMDKLKKTLQSRC